MGEPPTKDHSINRVNNNKGYCKSNCQWNNMIEQARNRHNNHLETYNRKTQCIANWSKETHLNRCTITGRLNRGWPIEKTLTTPVRKQRRKK